MKTLLQIEKEFEEKATSKQICLARKLLNSLYPDIAETFVLADCLIQARYTWEALTFNSAKEIANFNF